MIELAQDDFTVKVSGSVTLLELDTELAKHGQVSTLNGAPQHSINQILLENWGFKNHQAVLGLNIEHSGIKTKSLSEKRPDARHASPSKRSLHDVNEHCEGEHNNADGTFRTGSKCGGQVIKNVSGYDLAKLYIGSRGAYGQITSACLRTEKLASEAINYQIPEALWQLDLSHWQNCSTVIATRHCEEHDSATKQSTNNTPTQTTIKLWGDIDLLELRATKLEKQIKDYSKEKSSYQKQYLNTKTRIEINTTPSSLKTIFANLKGCDCVALPQNSAIYIYSENPAEILEKIRDLNYLFSAIIYPISPENQRLEQYYNAAKPDEERILEKLYAQFN